MRRFVVNAHAVNCGPWSVCTMVSGVMGRVLAAMLMAEFTSVVSALLLIAQLTALRD